MIDYDLYVAVAKWAGWPAISALLIVIMAVIIFVESRHVEVLKERIRQLERDLVTARDFTPDQLLRRLTQRHSYAMKELGKLELEKKSAQDRLEAVSVKVKDLGEFLESVEVSSREMHDEFWAIEIQHGDPEQIKARWESTGHCTICAEQEPAPPQYSNFIHWDTVLVKDIQLTGAANLVTKLGSCNYCSSVQVICDTCGALTSISLSKMGARECAGGCGTKFEIPTTKDIRRLELHVSSPMPIETQQKTTAGRQR